MASVVKNIDLNPAPLIADKPGKLPPEDIKWYFYINYLKLYHSKCIKTKGKIE